MGFYQDVEGFGVLSSLLSWDDLSVFKLEDSDGYNS